MSWHLPNTIWSRLPRFCGSFCHKDGSRNTRATSNGTTTASARAQKRSLLCMLEAPAVGAATGWPGGKYGASHR